jgi:hypothetical protein
VPAAVVGESFSGAEMFLNRVIMEFRATAPEHKEWAMTVKQVMQRLQQLVKAHFPQGLKWEGANSIQSLIGLVPTLLRSFVLLDCNLFASRQCPTPLQCHGRC